MMANERSSRRSVVVIGDVLRDIYVQSHVGRISPESPNVVIEAGEVREVGGGAAIGAKTLSNLGDDVVLASAWDRRDDGLLQGLDLMVVLNLMPGSTVPRKTRYLSDGTIVARVDDAHARSGFAEIAPEALEDLTTKLLYASSVMVADYGQDLTLQSEAVMQQISAAAQRIPVVWDFHPKSGAVAPPGCYVKFNRSDFDSFVNEQRPSNRTDTEAAQLLRAHAWRGILVTEGAAGATFIGLDAPRHIRCTPLSLRNAIGAGDMVSALWALFATEADGATSAARAVRVASLALAIREEALGDVPADVDPQDLAVATRAVRKRLVVAAGCFDLVHAGHVDLLREARTLGDVLIVLVNSDDSISRIKGPDRPICSVQDRTTVIQQLRGVNAVQVFDEDTPTVALAGLKPDVYVKGGDYQAEDLPEGRQLLAAGAAIHIVPLVRELSTTAILQRGIR